MATKVRLKKSAIAGRIPGSATLDYGELAINYVDGRLWYKNSSNAIKSFADSDRVQASISAATSSTATNVNVTANNSTNETVYLTFVDGATGTQGIETDTSLTYNPNSNLLIVDANTAAAGSDTISVRNSGISSTGHTTGLRFQYNAAVPAAIRAVNTNISNGAGRLGLFTSPDGVVGNLAERLSIDASGNVILKATSDTGNRLQINGADETSELLEVGITSGHAQFTATHASGGSNTAGFIFRTRGGGSTAERMRINSAGNVGLFGDGGVQTIDHYSNYTTLTLSNSTGGIIQFEDDGALIGEIFNGTNHLTIGSTASGASLRFRSAASSEAMRIDATGNLLVGVTSSSANMAGVEIAGNGQLYASTSSSSGHFFNRQSTDGNIVSFRKDGSTVGSIAVNGGDNIQISASAADHAGLEFATHIVAPLEAGAASNGAIDLGASSARFKDLYLSGGVVLDEASNTTATATTTSTSQAAIASFSATTYGSAEVVVTAKDGTARHITKFLIVHTGSAASHTEYGTVQTGSSLATFDVDINGGNVRVLATPASTNSTVFNVVMTLIDA